MFGLETEVKKGKKEKKPTPISTVQNQREKNEVLQRIKKKIWKIRNYLIQGAPKEDFVKIKLILEAYSILEQFLREKT